MDSKDDNQKHVLEGACNTLFINIKSSLQKIMNDERIKLLRQKIWAKFIENYSPKSSDGGDLIAGKRKKDPIGSPFFLERTFRDSNKRVNEWKNREKIFSMKCADTIFGEKFIHYLLKIIRIQREKERKEEQENKNNKKKLETEWFLMNSLEWRDITLIITKVCIFIKEIKQIRGIKQIDINSSDYSQIMTLPLIGPKLARKIIGARSEKLFRDSNDLMRIPKLGPGIIKAISEFITFGQVCHIGNVEKVENIENIPLNINTASKDELMNLPRIADKLSQKIIEYRNQNPFLDKRDIMNIKGIGPGVYSGITELITV